MRGLNGKSVIVTGGGGAIGSAICRRFASYGAKVGVFDRNLDGANKVAAEVKRIRFRRRYLGLRCRGQRHPAVRA